MNVLYKLEFIIGAESADVETSKQLHHPSTYCKYFLRFISDEIN